MQPKSQIQVERPSQPRGPLVGNLAGLSVKESVKMFGDTLRALSTNHSRKRNNRRQPTCGDAFRCRVRLAEIGQSATKLPRPRTGRRLNDCKAQHASAIYSLARSERNPALEVRPLHISFAERLACRVGDVEARSKCRVESGSSVRPSRDRLVLPY